MNHFLKEIRTLLKMVVGQDDALVQLYALLPNAEGNQLVHQLVQKYQEVRRSGEQVEQLWKQHMEERLPEHENALRKLRENIANGIATDEMDRKLQEMENELRVDKERVMEEQRRVQQQMIELNELNLD